MIENERKRFDMENIEKYYDNTKDALPHSNVRQFIKMAVTPTNAIDLGCGAGRDTVFLIKHGWEVLSIDKEDVEEVIASKLNRNEIMKFRFMKQSFENTKLEKNNLVIANFSLPFCPKDYFNNFWSKISDSIFKERLLCGELFWIK